MRSVLVRNVGKRSLISTISLRVQEEEGEGQGEEPVEAAEIFSRQEVRIRDRTECEQ